MKPTILVNLNAGAIRRDPGLVERLERLCAPHACVRATTDPSGLAGLCVDLARGGCQHVAIVGGDGSASMVLTALWKAYGSRELPVVALLPGGTMNTVAHSLGVPRARLSELASRAVRAWSGEVPVRSDERATLCAAGRLGFLFGMGLYYRYLERYYRAADGRPTPWTALRVLFQGALGAIAGNAGPGGLLSRTRLEVEADGVVWPFEDYLTVAAGTVLHAGLGFRPFARAFESTAHMHALGLHGGARQAAIDLPRVRRGRGFRPEVARSELVHTLTMRCPDGSFGYSMDGDLAIAEGALRVSVGPKIRFLDLGV